MPNLADTEKKITHAAVFSLLQLGDSAFPTGGFAYSSGLEAMARLGLIRKMHDLEEHIRATLEQALTADLPYALAAYTALTLAEPDISQFCRLTHEWHAQVTVPEMLRSSQSQGQAWNRLWLELNPEFGYKATSFFKQHTLPEHLLFVQAFMAATAGWGFIDFRMLWLHGVLRDQLAAAVRMGLIGPTAAQAMQWRLGPTSQTSWLTRELPSVQEAWRSFPSLEIAQGSHTQLYTRLFQN